MPVKGEIHDSLIFFLETKHYSDELRDVSENYVPVHYLFLAIDRVGGIHFNSYDAEYPSMLKIFNHLNQFSFGFKDFTIA